MNATRRLSLIYPLGLSLMAGAPAALGQTALGTGQGLYRDLQQRNSLASQGRDYAAEARNRNSIVFGRAPGGLSFRGGLGYKDPSEFLGRLGSQDLHSFMSASAYSATVSQGIRAQQAMDQQRALSVGAPRRPGLGGSLETPRGATSSGADLTRSRDSVGSLRSDPGAVRRDLARHPGNELSSRRPITPAGESGASARGAGLGSGSAFATTGNRGGESGEYGGLLNDRLGMTGRLPSRASSDIESFDTTYGTGPVGGARTLSNASVRRAQDKAGSDADKARMQSAAARPTDAVNNRVPGAGDDLRAQGQSAAIRTPYTDLVHRLDIQSPVGAASVKAQGAAPGTESEIATGQAKKDWEQRIDKLKVELNVDSGRPGESASLFTHKKSRSYIAGARPDKKDADAKAKRAAKEEPKAEPGQPGAPDEQSTSRLDPQTLRMIREAATDVESLAPIGATRGRDFFGEHMKIGQVLLEQGRYFDAEERFTRALAVNPGDVTAEIGRIHSQLGAGLFLSAGQNLRRLLTAHPEVAGLRYSGKLLPSGERAAAVTEQLRENLGGEGKLRRESALLLAYLGFQMRDAATAKAGVDAVAKIGETDAEAKGAGDARLAELLGGIWLDPSLYESKDAPEKK